jgi:hypothetical protein
MCAGDLELAAGHAYIALLAALIPYATGDAAVYRQLGGFAVKGGARASLRPVSPLTPSPPTEKAAARRDQAVQYPRWGREPRSRRYSRQRSRN